MLVNPQPPSPLQLPPNPDGGGFATGGVTADTGWPGPGFVGVVAAPGTVADVGVGDVAGICAAVRGDGVCA